MSVVQRARGPRSLLACAANGAASVLAGPGGSNVIRIPGLRRQVASLIADQCLWGSTPTVNGFSLKATLAGSVSYTHLTLPTNREV